MRILAIVADIDPHGLGGAERHFVEVLKRLAPKLEEATVLVGPDESIKEIFKNHKNIDVIKVNYPHISNLYWLFFILWATPKAIILSMKNKYDLIWAKQEMPQAPVGALVKIFTEIPLYITAQNPRLHKEEFVGLTMFSDLLTPIVSWSFRTADVVAAVSMYSAKLAREMGAKKVVVIPNGF